MKIVYLDYESFWSVEHSLTKINPILYVMHKETEIQSVSYAIDDGPINVLFGEADIRTAWSKIDWTNCMVVAHNNSGFDALIHAWRFGIKPKAWGCTLAMAKPFYGLTVGGSLKKVASEMGLGDKGSLDEVNTKGKKLKDFTPEEIEKMRVYNKNDTELCRGIFKGLVDKLSLHEMKLIDMAVRMTVDAELEADLELLDQSLEEEICRKHKSLLDLALITDTYTQGMTPDAAVEAMRDIVMSQPRFAALLTTLGAEVPMKISKTDAAKLIPALAKTDQGLEDLLEYDDPDGDEIKSQRVRVAASTRMEIKSTQLETRLRTYAEVARALGGKLPMPVNYCGAAISWRFSGGMKMNVQNNPRVNPKKPKPSDALRKSIVAPEGKILVVVDSSNIELRVAHTLAGQMDTVAKLKAGEDLYCWFASYLFGRVIDKDKDPDERFIGKVAMLSLQYGASWKAFQNMARILSEGKALLSEDECKRVVLVWRQMFMKISARNTGMWAKCDRAITSMFTGEHTMVDEWGLCQTTKERIMTPQAHWLQYPLLRKNMTPDGKDEWRYGEGRNNSRIYSSHLMENICQHLARIVVMEQTLALDKIYPVKLTSHDEAVTLVDEGQEVEAKRKALEIFSTSPKWWPELPVSAECNFGYDYAEAK